MAFWRATNVDLPSNSSIVTVNSGDDVGEMTTGYILQINEGQFLEVKTVNTGASPQTIELYQLYTGSAITSGSAIAAPTQGAIKEATEELRLLRQSYEGLADSVSTTNSANSVVKRDANGRIEATAGDTGNDVVVMSQLGDSFGANFATEQEVLDGDSTDTVVSPSTLQNKISDEGLGQMRSVVYDAMCEANRLKYGASGFVEFGKHHTDDLNSAYAPVNQGLWPDPSTPNTVLMGLSGTGVPYGTSATNEAVINVAGSIFHLDKVNTTNLGQAAIKLPPAPDGLDKADGTGRFADLAAAIVAGGNDLSASVLNRKDLIGVEVLDELVSDKDAVYVNGSVQYQGGNVSGITPSQSTTHVAQSYSAFYDGDTTTTGKCYIWSQLSDAEKDILLNSPKNNLRYVDGQLVQRRFRIRTIAGLEGDWLNIKTKTAGAIEHSNSKYFRPQGSYTSVESLGHYTVDNDNTLYFGNDWANRSFNDSGVYTAQQSGGTLSNNLAFNGFCVFIPIALVERMNQLAFHPTYNPNGTKLLQHKTLYSSNPEYAYPWYHDDAYEPTSVADCYTYIATNGNGVIGSISGHFAGLFHDAIYANQITDLRLDVSRKFSIERANRLAKRLSINGTASSNETEYVTYSQVWTENDTTDDYANKQFKIVNVATGFLLPLTELPHDFQDGDKVYAIDGTTITEYIGTAGATYLTVNSTLTRKTGVKWVIPTRTKHKSKYRTDIIGTPSEILATFPDGVHASWIPVLPDGTSKEFKYTRKVIDYVSRVFTTDGGVTWSIATNNPPNYSETGNSYTYAEPANLVLFSHYEYAPNFTEPVNQARVDYCGFKVLASNNSSSTFTASLIASLTGKVPTGGGANPNTVEGYNLFGYRIRNYDNGEFESVSGYEPNHDTLALDGVDSPAVKTFFYSHIPDSGIVEHYAVFKEMVFDSSVDTPAELNQKDGNIAQEYWKDISYRVDTGSEQVLVIALRDSGVVTFTDFTEQGDYYVNSSGVKYFKKLKKLGFGDNNKFNIVDGEAFVTDLNGNTIKVGCHKIKGIPQIFIPPTQLES